MRRISLALALVGAVAVTGCGGNVSPSSGDGKGTGTGTFTITIQNGQGQTRNTTTGVLPTEMLGGVVTGAGGLNCAAATGVAGCTATFNAGTSVTLTAAPTAPNKFLGWAGDCGVNGENLTCALTANGGGSLFVVAMFGVDRIAHPNWADPALHATSYLAFFNKSAGYLDCTSCHGANLLGQGLAPSCASCHGWPMGKHFEASGHNSGTCARCHAGEGFRDFVGADGSASNVGTEGYLSTSPAATEKTTAKCTAPNVPNGCTADGFASGMDCSMCHNPVTEPINGAGTWAKTKKFPSGNVLTLDASSALCAQCHDGGRPGYNVAQLQDVLTRNAATLVDAQLPTADNKVVRAHFLPAASTLYGADAANWYQFPNGTEPYIYTQRNQHAGKNACTFCHNAHTGELPGDTYIFTQCGGCHFDETTSQPVTSFLQLEESRQFGFGEVDVDGNGSVGSLRTEINGLGDKLYTVIKLYATNVATASICIADNKAYYDNGSGTGTPASVANDGACQPGEMVSANEYKKFTPRLLKGVYNYLMFQNDVGAWAHNPRYAIEVLFDTITDVNSALGLNAIDFQGFRSFEGHFGGVNTLVHLTQTAHSGSPVFHDWDSPAPATVGQACAQCHGGQKGLEKYLGLTGNVAMPAAPAIAPVPAFECSTCHAPTAADNDMKRIRAVANVYMPGQKGVAGQTFVTLTAADFDDAKDMVCASCHSGRENKNNIDVKIGVKLATDWSIGFTNPHYLGAMGVLAGTNAKMMYEYAGKTYAGWPINKGSPHGSPHGASCIGCHRPTVSKHSFEPDLAYCDGCHVKAPYGDYRLPPLKANVDALAVKLYATIQAYAKAAQDGGLGSPTAAFAVCYNGAAYPYWFKDTNSDGTCDAAESVSANGAKFNPAASKAAYNYKWSQAELGAYAHNYEYMAQGLIDSILDLDPAAVLPIDAKTDLPIVRP